MKNITVYSCSTGCHCYKAPNEEKFGASYIDFLETEYYLKGRWIDGFSIFHLVKELPTALCGEERAIIIHIGAVDAFTYRPENVLEWYSHFLTYYSYSSIVKEYIAPRMLKISHSLVQKEGEFFSIVEPWMFRILLGRVLVCCQGSKVILVGMGKPNSPEQPLWEQQAKDIDSIIRDLAKEFNQTYIDVWGACAGHIVDNNHLDEEGHKILYRYITNKF